MKPVHEALDFLVREEWVTGDIVLFLLFLHHIGGIVQHLVDQHAARLGEQHRGFRMLAHHDGQTADVVQMAMRDNDEIELDIAQQLEVRQSPETGRLGVKTAVDQNIQIADLQKE